MPEPDVTEPLLFHIQLEEHAKLMNIHPIGVYASATMIWAYLQKQPVSPADVHVAMPHVYNPKKLSRTMRVARIEALRQIKNRRRKHHAEVDEDGETPIEEEMEAQPVPQVPALIARYSGDYYAASAFQKQAVDYHASLINKVLSGMRKMLEADAVISVEPTVQNYCRWIAARKHGRKAKPNIENYLDWQSETLDVDTGGLRVILIAKEHDSTLRDYTNYVRIDKYVAKPVSTLNPVVMPY